MEEEAFNASSYEYNAKDEDEAFEDALTSDDDYSGDDDQEEDREERCRSILKNEFGNQRERVMRRDARKWQKMNAKKMRGRGDLGKATRKKNTIIIACPPVLPPHVDATQQVRGVNCGNIGRSWRNCDLNKAKIESITRKNTSTVYTAERARGIATNERTKCGVKTFTRLE